MLTLPYNPTKADILALLGDVYRKINKAKHEYYNKPWVTKERWDSDPHTVVSFGKDKIPALKAAGFIDGKTERGYGWCYYNAYVKKMREDLSLIEVLLKQAYSTLEYHHLQPKYCRFSDFELSRLTIIDGGWGDAQLIELLGGAIDG
jgi:hypothetical protein